MCVDETRPLKKTLSAIAVGLVCGAAIGFVFGAMIIPESLRDGAIVVSAFAVTGALFGAAVGAKIIRTTGWAMLVGATLGGVISILLIGYGKAAIYGAPIGTVLGLFFGWAIELGGRQSSDRRK